MRVLQVSHRFSPCIGGIETHIKELCEKLLEKGIFSSVICLNKCHNSKTVLPEKEKVGEVEVKRMPFHDLGFYKLAPAILGNTGKCDIIHVHGLGFFSDILAATKIFHRKKLVLSTHGGIFHTKNHSLLKKIYFFGWCRLALKAFDKVIAVSQQDKELFEKIVPKEKIILIENPLDIDKLKKRAEKSKGKDDFLFVGRLSKNKGLYKLLDVFARVKKDYPKLKLRIVGEEFDISEEQLRKEIKKLNLKDVKVLGRVTENQLQRIYTISGVCASASDYEGFGITAVEGMASGLVPILNNIPPFIKFVKDGETGFIVDFDKGEKAAETILDFLKLSSLEKKEISKKAMLASEKFSWKTNLAKFERVYRLVEAKIRGKNLVQS